MKKSSLVRAIILTSLIVVPLITFAVDPTTGSVSTGIKSLADLINVFTSNVVKALATLFLSLALLAFFYGIVEYIWGRRKGDVTATKTGNQFITWGLVALFVMFSVYGIIKLAQGFFGMQNVTTIEIPNIQFGGAGGPVDPNATGGGKANGVTCIASSECNSYYCSAGVCAVNTVDPNATGGKANGVTCTANSQCSSNYCNSSSKCATSGGGGTDYGCGPGKGYPDAFGTCPGSGGTSDCFSISSQSVCEHSKNAQGLSCTWTSADGCSGE